MSHRHLTFFFIILLGGGCASLQPCQPPTPEDIAVLQAVFDNTVLTDTWWQSAKRILFIQSLGAPTFPYTKEEIEEWSHLGQLAQQGVDTANLPQPKRETGRDLVFSDGYVLPEEVARKSEERANAICLSQPLAAGTSRVAQVRKVSANWAASFDGVVSFSAPGYDPAHQLAAVTVTRFREEGEGSTYLVVLRHTVAGWNVDRRVSGVVY